MKLIVLGLLAGAAFGFLLSWAHVTEYDAVHDMLLLRDPYLYLMMASGVTTAAIGARLLRALRVRAVFEGNPVSWSTSRPSRNTVWGSALFGAGWALACACPGPFTAQIGRGQWTGLLIAAGFFAGVALRGVQLARGGSAPAVAASKPAA